MENKSLSPLEGLLVVLIVAMFTIVITVMLVSTSSPSKDNVELDRLEQVEDSIQSLYMDKENDSIKAAYRHQYDSVFHVRDTLLERLAREQYKLW